MTLYLLQLTPLPAIPVYYALYRAFSHYQALSGCRTLATAFGHHDAHQLLVSLLMNLAEPSLACTIRHALLQAQN